MSTNKLSEDQKLADSRTRKHYEDVLEKRADLTGNHSKVIAAVLADNLDAVKELVVTDGENDSQLLTSVIVFASMYQATEILAFAMERAKIDGSICYEAMQEVSASCVIAGNFSGCYEQY